MIEFVKINKDLLLSYWNKEINTKTLLDNLVKI